MQVTNPTVKRLPWADVLRAAVAGRFRPDCIPTKVVYRFAFNYIRHNCTSYDYIIRNINSWENLSRYRENLAIAIVEAYKNQPRLADAAEEWLALKEEEDESFQKVTIIDSYPSAVG